MYLYVFITNPFHSNLSTAIVIKRQKIEFRSIFDASPGRTWENTLVVYFNALT